MKTSIGRMYATEVQARDAVERLKGVGIEESRIIFVAPGTGHTQALQALAPVPSADAIRYARRAESGLAVVVVEAFFGQGQFLGAVMNEANPVETDDLPVIRARNPAPFSKWIGMPTLSTRGRSYFKGLGELTSPGFSFSSKLGMKLLSNNPAPLSSMLGMKTVTQRKSNWTKSFGFPLLTSKRR